MSLENDFGTFIENLQPTNIYEMKTTVGEIAKKLNKNYYELDNDKITHMYIVGSIGRQTAIKGVSDLDILFDLPDEVFKRFDDYKEKKQSCLLQDVKNVLKERYPNTDISGDGQVIVIKFSKYTIELVPGFKQSDCRFKYPDTNNGGSWKYTNPLPEIEESKKTSEETNKNFKYMSNMLRAWKNKQGFKFGGLLIDTIAYKFINDNGEYKNINFDKYLEMSKSLFEYIKDLDKNQSYWYALGSNQKVYNCDNGKFIKKADKAYNEIKDLSEESPNINKVLRNIFGVQFPRKVTSENRVNTYFKESYNDTEEFIEDYFLIDIKYDISINCRVTQDGFRPKLLKELLRDKMFLCVNKSLKFYIDNWDVELKNERGYDIYWKVRNEGKEAVKRNCIRGQIRKINSEWISESSDFIGGHYVECYIVKDSICIAKDYIDVPISNYDYIMG